jgi:DNA-binding transcriptional regulator YbjK
MADRRTQLAEAALAVVAARGLKGLTHRAVDRATGVPPGTTSNHFRSRASLVAVVAERLEQRDTELLEAFAGDGSPADVEALAGDLADVVLALTREHADLTRVRLALSLDQPEAVTEAHRVLVSGLAGVLRVLAVPAAESRARAVSDYTDGLLLHALTARRDEPLDHADISTTILRLLR